MTCLCGADPCICEDEATQRAWAMVGYLNECQVASAKQREARRQAIDWPEYSKSGPWDCEPV